MKNTFLARGRISEDKTIREKKNRFGGWGGLRAKAEQAQKNGHLLVFVHFRLKFSFEAYFSMKIYFL